ncbi:MAG: hypothetical protein ACOCTG_05370 [Bacteroidota bacterium]
MKILLLRVTFLFLCTVLAAPNLLAQDVSFATGQEAKAPVAESLTATLLSRGSDVRISGEVRESVSAIGIADASIYALSLEGDTLGAAATTGNGSYELFLPASSVGIESDSELPEQAVAVQFLAPNVVHESGSIRLHYENRLSTEPPSVKLYDVTGREVGLSSVLAAGTYFVRMVAGGEVSAPARLVVVRPSTVSFRLTRAEPDARPRAVAQKSTTQSTIRMTAEHPDFVTVSRDIDMDVSTPTTFSTRLERRMPIPRADVSIFDVSYQPEAIVLDTAALAALVRSDTSTFTFEFDAVALSETGIVLEEGRPLFLPGITLRNIERIEREDDILRVETSYATLNQLIRDGEVGWEHEVVFDEVTLGKATVDGKLGVLDTTETSKSTEFKYKIKQDGGEYEIKIKLEIKGGVTTADAEVVVQRGGEPKARLRGKADLKRLKTSSRVTITDGSLESYTYSNDDLVLEAEAGIAGAGTGLGDLNFKMPEIAVPLKFMVGGIPISLNMKVQAVLKILISDEASATASAKFRYDGQSGFSYNGTSIEAKHGGVSYDFLEPKADAASTFSPVDLQYGVAFPRFEIGILGVPVIPYILAGYTVGTKLTWGPACKEGYVRMSIQGGCDLKFFDKDIELLDAVIWQQERKGKTDGCPDE